MSHPPYSPDLAPNDFSLFPYVKNKMRGQRFSTPEEVVVAKRFQNLFTGKSVNFTFELKSEIFPSLPKENLQTFDLIKQNVNLFIR